MPCANHRPELENDYHGRFEFGFQTEVLGSAATGQQPRTALQMHSLSAGEEPTGLGAMHVLMSCELQWLNGLVAHRHMIQERHLRVAASMMGDE